MSRFDPHPFKLRSLWAAGVLVGALLGCSAGGASVGETCATVADCRDGLQCLDHICKPACLAHINCGDGWRCDDGACVEATGAMGDICHGEVDCGPGLTCRLPFGVSGGQGTCEQEQTAAAVTGAACRSDGDCRNGACALGRCVELCGGDDCLRSMTCTAIPRVTADGAAVFDSFRACLPATATLVYDVPLRAAAQQEIAVPVVGTARSVTVVAKAESPNDLIGAIAVVHDGRTLYTRPNTAEEFYANPLRHEPRPGIAVLQIPTTSAVPLEPGAYSVTLEVTNPSGTATLDRGWVRIVEKLGTGSVLDLNFHIADLTEHPCLVDGHPLTPERAPTDPVFQAEYIGELRRIFAQANISFERITYDRNAGPASLAGLAAARAGDLFELVQPSGGVSIFLTRTLSPAGTEVVVGGTPGAPMPGTRASGIAVSTSTLCYRDWRYLARVTANGLARHLGLYRNRDPGPPFAVDPLVDSSTDPDNLMYWSAELGTELSNEQREVLRRSPALR